MLDHGDEIQLLKNELLTTGGALRRTEESLATERKNNERIIEGKKSCILT